MAGRPSTFKPEYVTQAKKLAKLGATDFELAEFFAITERCFRKWKHLHPKLVPALKGGQKETNDRVKRSLYQRAVGYVHESEKVFVHNGKVIRAKVVERYPPDTTAAIFWLKNREREEWRDLVGHEVTGKDGGPIQSVAATLPVDQADAARVYQEMMQGNS